MRSQATSPQPTRTTGRVASEHRMQLGDGCDLFYRAWAPSTPSSKSIVLFHRGHEHSGRWQDLVNRIDLNDYWIFAWDARGHGRTSGERGYAESFSRLVRDADEFVCHISTGFEVPIDEMAVIAQSVGAVLAAAWVHDYAPPIRALVLATPAFRVRLYVPFAIPALRLLNRIRPKTFVRSYVKPNMLTHDQEQARLYGEDELISPQIATPLLLDLYDVSTRLIKDAGSIKVPTLVLLSGSDWVVQNKPQRDFFDRLSCPSKQLETYPNFRHSTFWEKDRAVPIARSREFILDEFATKPPEPVDLTHGDSDGPEQEKYEALRKPLPALSPKRVLFGAQRFLLNTLGRLSLGIRTGWRAGFDSGESLDHVYETRAGGTTLIGRVIDRAYLDAPGWKGIRQRKIHIERMLDRAIANASAAQETRVLDIAAGPGRYLLDTIVRHGDRDLTATLCDRDEGGLDAGRALAAKMGVASAHYLRSDAFDADAIAAITPRPNIAVASGLFELFPSNAPIRESLAGLHRAVTTGGFLIYTNQPWHPQQEIIARVLPNRDGAPWVMRCRSQAEMDALVETAGFRKIDMFIDDGGVFTVSLARRVSNTDGHCS